VFSKLKSLNILALEEDRKTMALIKKVDYFLLITYSHYTSFYCGGEHMAMCSYLVDIGRIVGHHCLNFALVKCDCLSHRDLYSVILHDENLKI
jgi:hypothetical protein